MPGKYFEGFGDEEPVPQLQVELPETTGRIAPTLDDDVTAFSPLFEAQRAMILIDPSKVRPGAVHLENFSFGALNPTFIRYQQMQAQGLAIDLSRKPFFSWHEENPWMLYSMGSAWVTPQDYARANDIKEAFRPYGNNPPPFNEYTNDIEVNQFQSRFVFIGEFEWLARNVREEMFKEVVDGQGKYDDDMAASLYRRGFMTSVLEMRINHLRIGRDMSGDTDYDRYLKKNEAVYNELRARGELPLGLEEMHGIVARQMRHVLSL